MLLVSSRDPFAAHRQQMRSLFGPFGMEPFPLAPQMQPHRASRRQVTDSVLIDTLYEFCMSRLAFCLLPFLKF